MLAIDCDLALGTHTLPVPSRASRLTVREAADRWVETYVRTQRTGNGQKLAAQRVRDFFDPFMGHVLLERVTREDVRAFRLWLERTTRLSVTSVWHVLSDLRCLLNWCEDAGLVSEAPSRAG